MRKWLLLLLGSLLLCGCAKDTSEATVASIEVEELPPVTEITLAMYPVGNLGSITALSTIVSGFNESHEGIRVSVKYLNYTDGDAVIEDMLKRGESLNMVFEGPERLLANWGRRGLMADLSDLWGSYSEGASKEVISACQEDGVFYVYPVCTTAQCMAVNKDMLEEVGALKYINSSTRTWTTEDFFKTVELLNAAGYDSVNIYCASQAGDQGTRMFITNLYGGRYAKEDLSGYDVDSVENYTALNRCVDTGGIVFSKDDDGVTALSKFCNEEFAMSLCWNVSQEISHATTNTVHFDVYPVSFPTIDGSPAKLDSGLWGFGVFNGDEETVRACKEFIKYIVCDEENYRKVVNLSTFWPVFKLDNVYVNDPVMQEYGLFTEYVGDYYQITDKWKESRAAWWQMLQRIGDGDSIDASIAWFQQEVE